MKKKIVVLLSLVLIMCTLLCACGGSKEQSAEFGSVVTMDDFEVVVSSDILTASQLNFDKSFHNEFMTTDLSVGSTVDVAKDGYTLVVVSYTVKNVGKEDSTFKEKIILNYNDGYTYEAKEQYWTMSDPQDSWHLFTNGNLTSVDVSPLTTIECKAYLNVPSEVFTNEEASLKVVLGNAIYTVR